MPCSVRRSAKYSPSSTASRRGVVTSTNDVSGAPSSVITWLARSRKPASIPSNARKKAITSSMTSRPTTRATVRTNACAAALVTRNVVRVGAINSRKIRLSSRRVSRRGRVEEVEGVAGGRGVDDDELEPARRVQLVELLHRHVLLRAGEGTGDVAVEAVREDALHLLLVLRVLRDELVERRLRVEHRARGVDRAPRGRRRRARATAGSRAACSRGARARACSRGAWPDRW